MFAVVIKYKSLTFNTILAVVMFLTGFTTAFVTEPAFYLRGNIVVGVVSETLDLVGEMAEGFKRQFPFVDVTIEVLEHAEVEKAVLSGKVGIAVVSEFSVSDDTRVEYVCSGKRSFLIGTSFLSPVKSLAYQGVREIFENKITMWSHFGYDYGKIRIVPFLDASSTKLFADIMGLSPREHEFLQQNLQDITLYFEHDTEHGLESVTDLYVLPSEKLNARIHPIAVVSNGIVSKIHDEDDNVFDLFDEHLLEAHIYCVREKKTTIALRKWYGRALQNAWLDFVKEYLMSLLILDEDVIELCAVGDVMLDRGVKEVIGSQGHESLFSSTRHILSNADIVFCNLEGPITSEGRRLNMFRAGPDAVNVLKDGNIGIASIANNHILDFDDLGLMRTLENLSRAGIRYVGAGANMGEARREVIFDIKGMRIAFLAYTETWFTWTNTGRPWEATDTSPGVALACEEYMIEDIQRASKESDMVIVSVHWGKEYVDTPTEAQYRLGRTAIDAGASIVLGHHPHVLQGIEFYNGGIICYSLGNFIFDLVRPSTKETGIFKFLIKDAKVIGLEFIPCFIDDCVPVLVSGDLEKQIRERLRRNSLLIDTGKKRET